MIRYIFQTIQYFAIQYFLERHSSLVVALTEENLASLVVKMSRFNCKKNFLTAKEGKVNSTKWTSLILDWQGNTSKGDRDANGLSMKTVYHLVFEFLICDTCTFKI